MHNLHLHSALKKRFLVSAHDWLLFSGWYHSWPVQIILTQLKHIYYRKTKSIQHVTHKFLRIQIYRPSKFHIIRLLSFGKQRHVLWQKLANITEEPAVFNFRVRFHPEDGGSMLLWNSKSVPKNMASHPKSQWSSVTVTRTWNPAWLTYGL